MQLALKIDVDTLRGTREGVPNLVQLLKKHNARATFLFSLGPDHTGRAIKRAGSSLAVGTRPDRFATPVDHIDLAPDRIAARPNRTGATDQDDAEDQHDVSESWSAIRPIGPAIAV